MRRFQFILILATVFTNSLFTVGFGQEVTKKLKNSELDDERPTCFLGISNGKDNMVGLFGAQVDLGITRTFSLGGGIGISTWGIKYAFDFRVYEDGLYGSYLKFGYSHNTGGQVALDQYTVVNQEPIKNIFLNMGWAWKVAQVNRFYFELGYAWPTSKGNCYTLDNESLPLSESQKKAMKWLKPGGFVIAVGFDFAIFSF